MSSEEGSVEEQPVVIPEEPGKKIFINNVDSYIGQTLHAELRNESEAKEEFAVHTFKGTFWDQKRKETPEGVTSIHSFSRTKDFREEILASDVIVYDLMNTDYEEVDFVIKTLQTSEILEEKQLILLSSVMTWVNTPPKYEKELEEGEEENQEEEEEEEEEPDDEEDEEENKEEEENQEEEEEDDEKPKKKKVLFFKEKDYHLRVPHHKYQHVKTLESTALAAMDPQPKLKVFVCCAGVRYGLGERTFYEYFKQAWLQNPRQLMVFGDGNNLVPTIHIKDLSRLVKRISKDKPVLNPPYIFAFDKTKNPTQKRLVQSISKGIGTSEIKNVAEDEISDSWRDFLTINLKMKASKVFKDGTLPEDYEGEDEEGELAKLKFPWHCKKGVPKNIRLLNDEFNQVRGLNPIKIFLQGPPASGKSYFSKELAHYYNIPHIEAKEIVKRAFFLGGLEETEDEFANEIKEKIEEIKDQMFEKYQEEKEAEKEAKEARGEPVDEEEEEEDPDEVKKRFNVRLPNSFLYRLLRTRLNENDCRNRGYVLDGFPRTFKDCQYVFLKLRPPKDEDEEVEDEEIEPEDGGEPYKTFKNHIADSDIFPSNVIVLEASDKFLLERVKELPEEEIEGTHYNPQDMVRRLKSYQEANKSDNAEPSIKDFFENQGQMPISVLEKPIEGRNTSDRKIINAFKIYIERNEKPFNYMTYDKENENERFENQTVSKKQAQENQAENNALEEVLERELRKQKEAYTKQKNEKIKEQERDLLDFKSQAIRSYLAENLVQILGDGLIDVCRKTPEDPVDHLAEYLFKRSLDVLNPDPTNAP